MNCAIITGVFHFLLRNSVFLTDLLTITDLEIWSHIGVSDSERITDQRLLVTIEMMLDSRIAAKSDDVKKSINYFDVCEDVKKLALTERKTIERFAEDVAQMILKMHKPDTVTVSVKKFAIAETAHVSLTVTRKK